MKVVRSNKAGLSSAKRFTCADVGTVFEGARCATIDSRYVYLVAYNGIINLESPSSTFSFSHPNDGYTFYNVTFPDVHIVVGL